MTPLSWHDDPPLWRDDPLLIVADWRGKRRIDHQRAASALIDIGAMPPLGWRDDPPLLWAGRGWATVSGRERCGGQETSAQRMGGNRHVGRCTHTPHARSSSDHVEGQGVTATE